MHDLALTALAAGHRHGARIAILALIVVVVIIVVGWVIYAARRRRGEKS
jgi:type VI protein secretion system component VasK